MTDSVQAAPSLKACQLTHNVAPRRQRRGERRSFEGERVTDGGCVVFFYPPSLSQRAYMIEASGNKSSDEEEEEDEGSCKRQVECAVACALLSIVGKTARSLPPSTYLVFCVRIIREDSRSV
jgi:hypothetical protein